MVNLTMLLAKFVYIFVFSYLLGGLVLGKKNEDSVTIICLRSIVGLCVINLASIFCLIVGLKVKNANLIIGLVCVILITMKWAPPINQLITKRAIKYILFSLVGVSFYFLPFYFQGTGGYYSRGGGDHNTYLSLSSWYNSNSFLKKISIEDTEPVKPNFEVKYFTNLRQRDLINGKQPIANQVFSSVFMELLPGPSEEAYTAAVGVYFVVTAWALLILVLGFFSEVAREEYIFFLGPVIMASNLYLYIATTQAIPFLFSIGLMCMILSLAEREHLSNNWRIRSHEFAVLLILSCCLFDVYPHVYFMTMMILGIIFLLNIHRVDKRLYVRFNLFLFFLTLAFGGWLGVANLDLVFSIIAKGNQPSGVDYTWAKVIATQSGIADFLLGEDRTKFFETTVVNISLVFSVAILGTIVSQIPGWVRKKKYFLISLILVFMVGLIYYKMKGFGYQVVRFSEIGHLFYLSIFFIILLGWIDQKAGFWKAVGYSGFIFFLFFITLGKAAILDQVLGDSNTLSTEFRSSEDLALVRQLGKGQKCIENHCSPIFLYMGNGYGVDHAGASVLLRNYAYISAYGYEYADVFQSFDGLRGRTNYDTKFLQDAIIVRRSPDGIDIISDERKDAAGSPKSKTAGLQIYDTSFQNFSGLVGTYWGAPRNEFPNGTQCRVRYLQGKPGALVIWSGAEKSVEVTFSITSVQADAQVMFKNTDQADIKYDLPAWNGSSSSRKQIVKKVHLVKGANVIEVQPLSKGESGPGWLMFWGIVIQD